MIDSLLSHYNDYFKSNQFKTLIKTKFQENTFTFTLYKVWLANLAPDRELAVKYRKHGSTFRNIYGIDFNTVAEFLFKVLSDLSYHMLRMVVQ